MYGVISYAMSKAGLKTLIRYADAEFANLSIRINAISNALLIQIRLDIKEYQKMKLVILKKKCKVIYL